MKAFKVTFFSLIVLFSYCLAIGKGVSAVEEADRLAQKVFDDNDIPGMAVAVWKEGEMVFQKGYGFADIANQIPIDPVKSKFRIGSISKPFTAAALATLYDAGKIDLDADIRTYVPYFHEKEWSITLRQVAGHLAGIRHYKKGEFLSNHHYETVEEGLGIFMDDPLLFKPGSKFAYSSYGWNLVSAAIEGASGQPFLAYMQTAVFDRIRLRHSMPDFADREIEHRVVFYKKVEGKNVIGPPVDNSYKWAGGGFLSSSSDVVRFGIFHLSGGFMKESTLAEWTKTQQTTDGKPTGYGIGWSPKTDDKGRKSYGHGGGSVGGTSMLQIYPEEQLIVVVLINLSQAKMDSLTSKLVDVFTNEELAGISKTDQEKTMSLEEFNRLHGKPRKKSTEDTSENAEEKINGQVVLEFVVTKEGDVVNAKVVESTHPDFEAPALEAVRSMKFAPEMKDGIPHETRMRLPMSFQSKTE